MHGLEIPKLWPVGAHIGRGTCPRATTDSGDWLAPCHVTMQAKSEEDKSKWCQCLKKLILDNYEVDIPPSARHSLLMLASSHCLRRGTCGSIAKLSQSDQHVRQEIRGGSRN